MGTSPSGLLHEDIPFMFMCNQAIIPVCPDLQDLSNRGLGEGSNKLGSGDMKKGDKSKNSVKVSVTLGKQRA